MKAGIDDRTGNSVGVFHPDGLILGTGTNQGEVIHFDRVLRKICRRYDDYGDEENIFIEIYRNNITYRWH